jgi:hypothetical protein
MNTIDWNNMISASAIINYIIDDPLIDWLKYYNINSIYDKPNRNHNRNKINNDNNNFTNFIMNEGLIFENKIYEKLMITHQIIKV